jgi:hypothetical protein
MIMKEKVEKDTILTPDSPRFLNGIELISQKHTQLLTDLMNSCQRAPPTYLAHERPGLVTEASAAVDLEKNLKQHPHNHRAGEDKE